MSSCPVWALMARMRSLSAIPPAWGFHAGRSPLGLVAFVIGLQYGRDGTIGRKTCRHGSIHQYSIGHFRIRMFVVSLSYTQPMAEVEKHLEAHRTWLDHAYAAGHLLMSGRKEPRTGGIIVMRASNLAAAQAILAEDPFHKAGVADYQITEFQLSKAAPALQDWLEA